MVDVVEFVDVVEPDRMRRFGRGGTSGGVCLVVADVDDGSRAVVSGAESPLACCG